MRWTGIAAVVITIGCGPSQERERAIEHANWGGMVEGDVAGPCRDGAARPPVAEPAVHDRAGAGPLTLVIHTRDLDTGDPAVGVLATLDGDERNAQLSDDNGAVVFAAVEPGKHQVGLRGASDGERAIAVEVVADQTTSVDVRVDGVPRCR